MGAVVSNSILMPNVTVEKDAIVEYAIIARGAQIGQSSQIGQWKRVEKEGMHRDISVVGEDITVAARSVVPAGTVVSADIEEVSV